MLCFGDPGKITRDNVWRGPCMHLWLAQTYYMTRSWRRVSNENLKMSYPNPNPNPNPNPTNLSMLINEIRNIGHTNP